jgi:hypothetical protein
LLGLNRGGILGTISHLLLVGSPENDHLLPLSVDEEKTDIIGSGLFCMARHDQSQEAVYREPKDAS